MASKTVLVVEDNADELMIYTTLLRHAGYTVVAADDFASALHAAATHRPDVAVIDVNLGHAQLDGCDLAIALRKQPQNADLAIIAHTAYGDVYRNALDRVGCERVLHKPSNPAALVEAVADLIGPADPTLEV
ncbi:MAG TPA: response regulator [Longimicrobiales bacterium]|nr:response regulator [Longimicrobiales bacterium]